MKIAHVEAPFGGRGGGPAGYLLQLEAAAATYGAGSRHQLIFPPHVPVGGDGARSHFDGLKSAVRRARRTLVGPPDLWRPTSEDLRRPGGAIDAMLTASWQKTRLAVQPVLEAALASDADILFTHDSRIAAQLLDERRSHQQIWLFMHAPMPLGLEFAWSWGIPEWPWGDIAQLPDTAKWISWELDVASRVDRYIFPCVEAVDELVRVNARFAKLRGADLILTGAAAPARRYPGESRASLRRRCGLPSDVPIGLFIGNAQPYRGLDILLEAVKLVPATVPGELVVAGPPQARISWQRRVRALGPVSDVGDLLHAVDFVVNVNVFSLFDLSTIEAAQAGCPMLLHATGGNLQFERLGAGCVMLPDLNHATIARGLSDMFTMSDPDRRALSDASRACYEQHLTPAHFWANHMALCDHAEADVPVLNDAR